MSGVFILCQIWIVIIICVMAIDWKNLIQIQVSEGNGYSHDQSTVEVNKPDQYALNMILNYKYYHQVHVNVSGN